MPRWAARRRRRRIQVVVRFVMCDITRDPTCTIYLLETIDRITGRMGLEP
jgi:hypothetical protein